MVLQNTAKIETTILFQLKMESTYEFYSKQITWAQKGFWFGIGLKRFWFGIGQVWHLD